MEDTMTIRRIALVTITFVVLACASMLLAHSSDNATDVLRDEASQAIGKADFAAGDGLLSADYVGFRVADGRVLSAFQDAAMLYSSIDSRGLQATVFGSTGVVTGIVKS
jgi:hypothetical protein